MKMDLVKIATASGRMFSIREYMGRSYCVYSDTARYLTEYPSLEAAYIGLIKKMQFEEEA